MLSILAAGVAYGAFNQECTVGVTATSATVTIHGFQPEPECTYFSNVYPTATYRRTAALSASVICEYNFGHWRYTVRDEGSLKIIGSGICTWLHAVQGTGHGVGN